MVALWVVFGALVHHVGDSWPPVETVLTLRFLTTELVKTLVHEFNTLGDISVFHETSSSGAVGLYGQLLGWGQLISVRVFCNHRLCGDKNPTKFNSAVEDISNLMI